MPTIHAPQAHQHAPNPSFTLSANLLFCAKKSPKTPKRSGNEPEALREIQGFCTSNLRLFAFPRKNPRTQPEALRLALSKTRFSDPFWPLTTDHWPLQFNVSRQTPFVIQGSGCAGG